jgi:hypothetical protein
MAHPRVSAAYPPLACLPSRRSFSLLGPSRHSQWRDQQRGPSDQPSAIPSGQYPAATLYLAGSCGVKSLARAGKSDTDFAVVERQGVTDLRRCWLRPVRQVRPRHHVVAVIRETSTPGVRIEDRVRETAADIRQTRGQRQERQQHRARRARWRLIGAKVQLPPDHKCSVATGAEPRRVPDPGRLRAGRFLSSAAAEEVDMSPPAYC